MSLSDIGVTNETPVQVETLEGGAFWRVRLCTPKANILDTEKILLLTRIFEQAREDALLKCLILDAEGPHFSFGASVEEHLPGKVVKMIQSFHTMFYRMLEAHVVTLCAVRGQCLGGGLELACFCHRVFAGPDSNFGQPEIQLGVFAPVASVILSERIGRSRAEDLCLSGRTLGAHEAHQIGLVDDISKDPSQAALAYAREHLLPRSARSLRLAVRAVRHGFATKFRDEIRTVEELYLKDLMSTRDAVEGLTAFLDKRQPKWSNS